ncbi:hypothetical protein DPMN_065968 [Dreissena polymorpha]|uniref:Uncharacterized protein n=1 Tax=Dreissena polymorpha TaxID=45954 RepID=A0A9D4BRP0_DREPO|nr:hypothetical protein DPMN_065968 [Dreissena polymorpha]
MEKGRVLCRFYCKALWTSDSSFDGYEDGPSIKDNIHQRREKNVNPIVSFTKEKECYCKRKDFLSRGQNKTGVIALISTALIKRVCYVVVLLGDADVDIVKATVEQPPS